MPGRYDQWHHLRLVGDPGLAKRYLPEGRKWLEYAVQEAARISSSTVRKVNSDGVIFTAVMIGAQPILMIDVRGAGKPPEPVDLAGFVTWPTDAGGNTALPDSARVILAGDAYRQVRHGQYSQLFPDRLIDPEDPDSGTEDGLAHAGNVDWQGKEGWVLSWYGPRTRYLDSSINLDPRVFFKGRVLVDMRDYIDPDALVLGAAVTTFPSGQWLVVVTEVPGTTRIERVSALALGGDPTDVELVVSADSYTEVDSRTTTDINNLQHPWFFSPDGKEARQIARHSSDLLERIINLVESDGLDPGFVVERSSNTVARPTASHSSGYSAGELRYHMAGQDVVYRYLGGGAHIDTYPGSYQVTPQCLHDWRLEDNVTLSGDPWVAIAVDYKADGSVVYGYGRASGGTDVTSGDYTLDAGGDYVTPGFFSDTLTEEPPGSGLWYYDASTAYPDIAAQWHTTRQRTRNYVSGGLRVGAIEVSCVDTATENGRSDSSSIQFATPNDEDHVPVTGSVDDGFLANGPVGGDIFSGYATATAGTVTYQLTREITITTDTYKEAVYLLHMDLRYEALFYMIGQVTTYDRHDTSIDYRAFGDPAYLQTTTDTLWSGVRNAYLTRGWINGALVLEDAITTVDTLASAPISSTATDVPVDGPPSPVDGVTGLPPDGTWFLSSIPTIDLPGGLHDTEYWGTDIPDPVVAPMGLAYHLSLSSRPFVQGDTLVWQIAIAPATVDGIVGYSNVSSVGDDAKFKWHFDADGRRFPGSVCCFKNAWVFSLALPAINDGSHDFRFVSQCVAGDVKPLIQQDGDPPFDHVYPIWLLGKTRGFRPT